MAPSSENEIAGKVCEVTSKSEEQSGLPTRTDTMSQNKWTNKFTTFAVGVGVGALLDCFLRQPQERERVTISLEL